MPPNYWQQETAIRLFPLPHPLHLQQPHPHDTRTCTHTYTPGKLIYTQIQSSCVNACRQVWIYVSVV